MDVAYVNCYLDQHVIVCFAAVFIFCEVNLIMKSGGLFASEVVWFVLCCFCNVVSWMDPVMFVSLFVLVYI